MIHQTSDQIRALIKGLHPVEVDAHGLQASLQNLAESTTNTFGIDCLFGGDERVTLHDNNTATQMYYIAREAVHNAAKHAQAATQITVSLGVEDGQTTLRVRDNGRAGISDDGRQTDGMGLGIMKYRATLIGATLNINIPDGGGTAMTCRLRESHGNDEGKA